MSRKPQLSSFGHWDYGAQPGEFRRGVLWSNTSETRSARVRIPSLMLPPPVALGKSHPLSLPQFPQVHNHSAEAGVLRSMQLRGSDSQ